MSKTTYLLTGDIGGTNSRLSFYTAEVTACHEDEPIVYREYRNAEHLPEHVLSDPDAFQNCIIKPFLEYCWATSESLVPLQDAEIIAILATAGLVLTNAVKMTNLGDLLVDGNAIELSSEKYLRQIVKCQVINDFVAQGFGCLTLDRSEVKLLSGPSDALDRLQNLVGPKVCVGAGTGLGECYLTPYPDNPSLYSCFASEGGHVEYAPRTDEQVGLWRYLTNKFVGSHGSMRVSVERVVSGKGLANVYEFLARENPDQVDPAIHKEFLAADDEQGKVVGVNATVCVLCRRAMEIMMHAYGSEVGSAAIKWIPTGGLFVTGGLTPKNIKFIEGDGTKFMKAYLDKGRVSPLLARIPLFAVMVEDLGVRGAHKAALTLYEQRKSQAPRPAALDDRTAKLVSAVAVGFIAGLLVQTFRRFRMYE